MGNSVGLAVANGRQMGHPLQSGCNAKMQKKKNLPGPPNRVIRVIGVGKWVIRWGWRWQMAGKWVTHYKVVVMSKCMLENLPGPPNRVIRVIGVGKWVIRWDWRWQMGHPLQSGCNIKMHAGKPSRTPKSCNTCNI